MPIINKRYYMNPSYGNALERARQKNQDFLKPIIESLESGSIRPLLKIFEDNRSSQRDDLIPQNSEPRPLGSREVSASAVGPQQASDTDGHWVTINGKHVFIHEARGDLSQEHHSQPEGTALPSTGEASIYSDIFEGEKTSNGEIFRQRGYTAALLPRSRWHPVPLGTRVEITHDGSRVVVEVNDRGAGDRNSSSTRALDLSRAAASALIGRDVKDDKDAKKVGLIHLDTIRVVPKDTPLGPVRH